MKKIIAFALLATCFSCFISCDKEETYADKLKNEKKSIKRLLRDSTYVILDEYPKNGVFKKNEFFLEPQTGIYINVVDSGNGNRASAADKTTIIIRYEKACFFSTNDTLEYSNNGANLGEVMDNIEFDYGKSSSYTSTSVNDGFSNYYFKSVGMVAPLAYVGENAVVKLIIPFSAGSGFQQYYGYEPVFIGELKYTFRAR